MGSAEYEAIMYGFEYEDCHNCGQDAEGNMISIGPFGEPRAVCITELEQETTKYDEL